MELLCCIFDFDGMLLIYYRYLAYGSASDRYKAVALDGTLFERSGIISGGGQELRQRAKKWDENAIRFYFSDIFSSLELTSG